MRRRYFCLVQAGQPDKYVSLKYWPEAPASVEHLGVTYSKTSRRTQGGWLVYRAN